MSARHVALVLASALIATNAYAQVSSRLNEVNFTATVGGSKISGGDSSTGATLTGAYGRFLTDAIEVGPQVTVFKSGGSDAFGTINGAGAYHFNTRSRMVPFVGGQIGRGFGLSTDYVSNPWSVGVFGGVKAFLGQAGAITLQPFWTRQSITSKVSDESSQLSTYGVSAGVSIFWQ